MTFPAITAVNSAAALSYPPRIRFRAMVKLSAVFFYDESSMTKGRGGYESATVQLAEK